MSDSFRGCKSKYGGYTMKTILTYPMQVMRVQRGPPKMLLELAKRCEWKRQKYHKM